MPLSAAHVSPRVPPGRLASTADPEWVKALFLAPAVVGSFATLMALGQTRGVRDAVRRWFGRGTAAGGDLAALRASMIGQPMRRVMARFGTPPAATSAPTVTWYYPVAGDRPTAMAVTFDADGTAGRVEFFHAPG